MSTIKSYPELEAELKKSKELLDAEHDESSKRLSELCAPHRTGRFTVSEEFKATEEYQAANKRFTEAFQRLREFNSTLPVELMRKWSNERKEAKRAKAD